MIIEDIKGNIITNPNLEKGKLEKAFRTNEQGEQYDIYIYFPFSEDEQTAYNTNNQAAITTDKANCQVYEATKSSLTDTDPFAYAYARRIKRGEVTLAECPSELQSKIEEIVAPSGTSECDAMCNHGIITGQGATVQYPKGSSVVLDITASDAYRVPTIEELLRSSTIYAEDENEEEIADFYNKYMFYKVIDNKHASFTMTIPSNCVFISINMTCIEDGK